jgi:hypothetical protein
MSTGKIPNLRLHVITFARASKVTPQLEEKVLNPTRTQLPLRKSSIVLPCTRRVSRAHFTASKVSAILSTPNTKTSNRVIILSNKRPASTSPPRSPPSIQTTTSTPPSPKHNSSSSTSTSAVRGIVQPVSVEPTSEEHKHTMGSKGSKLAPAHGKLQPSQDKQDKAEMKEPSNYYTHRSKSMRRKAGKTGATSATGGSGGGAGGGVGGAV